MMYENSTFIEICKYIGRKQALLKREQRDKKKYNNIIQETIEEFITRGGKIQKIEIKNIIANNPEFYINVGSWRETDRNNN